MLTPEQLKKMAETLGISVEELKSKLENGTPAIKLEELTTKIKKELEDKAKAEAEAEAKAKAEHDALVETIRKEEAEKAKADIEADTERIKLENDKFKNTKKAKKMDDQSEEIYEALKSNSTLDKEFDFSVNDVNERIEAVEGSKANIDGASSYGAEFVPGEFAPGFYFRMGSMHGSLMNLFPKIGMSTDKKSMQEILTKPTISAYSSYVNQNTAIENVTATDITTATQDLTARKFVAKINVYDTVLADEKFGLMKGIKQALADELAASVSSAILNGDTTAIHMDEDFEAAGANIPEAMWKGIRKLTLAGSLGVDGSATYTLAEMESVKKLMGKYALGVNGQKSVWILGPKTYNQLVSLWRASTSTPNAADFAIKNGTVETYLGHRVIVSDKQREDLEVSGYFETSGTAASEGFASLVNTSQFVLGIRDAMSIKVVPDPLNDRKVVQATLRMDFQPFEAPSTTISTCAALYNFTT